MIELRSGDGWPRGYRSSLGPQATLPGPPFILRPLRRAIHSAAAIALPKKSIFNFRVTMEPLLRTLRFFLISSDLRFQLRNPIFGRAQLMHRLRPRHSMLPRIDKKRDDGLFAKRLGGLQPVQTLNEYEARAVRSY